MINNIMIVCIYDSLIVLYHIINSVNPMPGDCMNTINSYLLILEIRRYECSVLSSVILYSVYIAKVF